MTRGESFTAAIADQTNLPARDAAMEAARAGEHGRGLATEANPSTEEASASAEQTSASTEQVAAPSRALAERAASLRAVVERFTR